MAPCRCACPIASGAAVLAHCLKGDSMPQGDEVFAGLNKGGVILFIVLLLVCLPLCWLPWVIDGTKAANRKS